VDSVPIPGWIIDGVGPVASILGCLWLIYWLVSSGRLVPRSTVDLLMVANDKVNEAKDKTIASQERQIDALLDVNETTKHALEALQQAAAERQVSNGSSS
jgi:hypothetical protein